MRSLLIVLCLTLSTVYAQKGTKQLKLNDKRTGISEIFRVSKYDETKKAGAYKYLYLGNVQAEGNYVENLKQGLWVFRPNSDFRIEGSYENDKKDGTWKYYNNEVLTAVIHFKEGKRDGIQTSYFPNGKVATENTKVAGTTEGISKSYYESGQLKESTTFSGGEKNGECRSYWEDGTLIYAIEYFHGQPITLISQQSGNFPLFYEGDLKDGNGSLILYSSDNGNKIKVAERNYRDSVLDGPVIYNSQVEFANSFTGQYKNGFMVGEWIFKNDERSYREKKTYSLIDSLKHDAEVNYTKSLDDRFAIIEEMPCFGPNKSDADLLRYVGHAVNYPSYCKENGIAGVVYVSYIVGIDGLPYDVKVVKGVHPLIDAEGIRVLEGLPYYQPGLQSYMPVPVQFTIPIRFALN
ncbi:MAG: hypothetical protein GC178_08615 [Flavobacteriales bacterium]|nr:hypothetical protein [Flavobacteriales bacterium]